MKSKVLIVVDMQNDFIDGSLGTPEAQAIVPKVVEKIKNWDGDIIFTKDTHDDNYLNTREGRHLPIKHCIFGTEGYIFHESIVNQMSKITNRQFNVIQKHSFGCHYLSNDLLEEFWSNGYEDVNEIGFEFHICGLCTDICVISNAVIIQSYFPEAEIYIDASCCAGTTPEMHKKALDIMHGLQMNIINDSVVS